MMKARHVFLALTLVAVALFAQQIEEGVGGQGAMLFEAGGSARSLAMGQAYTAIADQGEAVLYNPAGLGQIHSAKLSLLGGTLYGNTYQSVLAYNMPWATYGTFGLAYAGAFGTLEETTTPDGTNIAAEDGMSNSGVMISYAKKFSAFSVGLAPKILFSRLSDEQALAFDVDVGFMLYPLSPILAKKLTSSLPYDLVTLGVAAKNLLAATMDYTGSGMEPANPRIIRAGLGIRLLDNRVKLASDISYTLDDNEVFGWYEGLEVYPARLLALRAGINHNFFSFGLGVNTDLSRSVALEVDYAFMMNYASEFLLEPIHKVSLNLNLKNVAGLWLASRPAELNSPADYAEISVNGAAQFKGRIKRWVFEIKDAGGNVVYRKAQDVYGEIDELPSKFTWNGVNSIRGGQVDKGTYYYQITITDKLGDKIVYEGLLLKVDWKGVRR
ncbi:MAG: hypothetical protein E3J71_04885 [Candidatus Stahlbacteria bacterium]|nr:MAG: hypothetical protein E3J71_04885 [Candidatus Stahlbacteria bacterium]